MSEEEIRGRTLIVDGRFSDWRAHWDRIGEKGYIAPYQDDDYGMYLMLQEEAAVRQTFKTAPLTGAQLTNAWYRLNFQYENYGDGPGSKVIIRPATGDEDTIDLSGIIPEQPQADWNPYLRHWFIVVEADEEVTVELHGTSKGDANGLRITDLDVQLHLAPLRTRRVQVDDRVYVG